MADPGEDTDAFVRRTEEYEQQMMEKYKEFGETPMVYAVGDGNHSLATARLL